MIFWTIFYLIMSVSLLAKGGFTNEILLKHSEIEIKLHKKEEVDKTEMTAQNILVFTVGLIGMAYLVGFLVYLSVAMSIPSASIFSITVLIMFLINLCLNVCKNKKYKKDLDSEEGRVKYLSRFKKKRTVRSVFTQVLHVVYFAAMLILLMA